MSRSTPPFLLLLIILSLLPPLEATFQFPPIAPITPVIRDSPHRMRQHRQCRMQLIEARKQLRCALLRISLPRRMSSTRHCLYNGLPFSEYSRIREICRNRSESLTRLRAAKRKCRMAGVLVRTLKKFSDDDDDDEEEAPVDVSRITCADLQRLWKERKRAVAACTKIGWTGQDRRAKCGSLLMLKKRLWTIEESGCGEGSIRELREKVRIKEMRCGRAGGVVLPPPPRPSNAPRP